jgi:predicted RNA-binding protein
MKYQNYDRLQSILDERNKVILIKEKLIEKFNAKNIELRSKVNKGETLIKELENQNECESCLCEIGMLKVKI